MSIMTNTGIKLATQETHTKQKNVDNKNLPYTKSYPTIKFGFLHCPVLSYLIMQVLIIQI